ncbi:MAG: S-adenosylhomocysteine deaminase [Sulfobacillus acidophilus]|uniref:S-adenosylhomocysteine deaminase n=1 Tax=Sulfobacillus acidophilus TaxID=53633 RepID=A0A2T2WDM0_9FIRM|nr:MAG: S-adenosylhomocysteine deaminase [Sulfobacillus acidophilus]
MQRRYNAAYVWTEEGLRPDWSVVVDEQSAQIVAVAPRQETRARYPDAAETDWRECALLPGTVNVHAHAFQHLARGRGVDQPFLQWRDQALYHITPHLDAHSLYLASKLAFVEMLRAGITTVAEFFYVHGDSLDNDRAVIQAARDSGIRLAFARAFYDWQGAPGPYRETIDEAVRRTQTLAQEVAGDSRVSLHVAPHSLHGASDDMIRQAYALSRDLNVPCHIHVAEEQFEVDEVRARTGRTPVEHLRHLEVLGPHTIAVHLVWITPGDIEILAQTRTQWAYCPSSNLFLADGIAPLPQLVGHGITAGLGTDGGCSNNRSSIFEEMRMAALVHKGYQRDATAVNWPTVLEMGTSQGAQLLTVPAGIIAPGHLADFIGINLSDPSLIPWTPDTLLANVVYSMQPSAVQEVVVDGRPVVRDRAWQSGDQAALIQDVQTLVHTWQA